MVCKVFQLLPATNSTSERSFSALRWQIKFYLRSSISQACMNHLMILHYHHAYTDSLDMKQVANEFISARDTHEAVFCDVHKNEYNVHFLEVSNFLYVVLQKTCSTSVYYRSDTKDINCNRSGMLIILLIFIIQSFGCDLTTSKLVALALIGYHIPILCVSFIHAM